MSGDVGDFRSSISHPHIHSHPLPHTTYHMEQHEHIEDDESDGQENEFYPLDTGVEATRKHPSKFTQLDAESIVGGEEPRHDQGLDNEEFSHNKVFLFSLPFGGLSGIRSGFKLPSLPFVSKDEEPDVRELRLRLERQQSLNTIDEARAFSNIKGTDDVRLRAMKQSIKDNISDLLPEFMTKKAYDSVYNDLEGPVVVMGGYRGSILRDTSTGKRVWIPLKAGFNLRKIDLLLGLSPEDELNVTDSIYPDGILKNIGPFDICKKFLKKLCNGKTTFKEFGYDWRISLDISAQSLIDCLEDLFKSTGKKTIVIAHSMGGLVAHLALQKRPDLFRGLIYVGVPSECLNILGPIRYGKVFWNEKTGESYDIDFFDPDNWVEYNLNPLVSTFRKEQELKAAESEARACVVPEDTNSLLFTIGSIGSKIRLIPSGINRKTKSIVVTNLQMQKIFKASKSAPTSPIVPSESWGEFQFSFSFTEAYNYLKRTLLKTKETVLKMDYNQDLADDYPPLAVVYGNTVPSVRGSYVNSRQDIKDGNYYEFFYGRGDGVVHQRWLMPELKGFDGYDPKTGKGHIVGKFATTAGHVDLMTDLDVMADAISAIVEADKVWGDRKKSKVSLDEKLTNGI